MTIAVKEIEKGYFRKSPIDTYEMVIRSELSAFSYIEIRIIKQKISNRELEELIIRWNDSEVRRRIVSDSSD